MPRLAHTGDGAHGAMLAAAARTLGWEVVAADDAVAADVGIVDADIVVVDTPPAGRAADAVSLLGRGIDVVLTPGCDPEAMDAVVAASDRARPVLAIGEPFPTAPAVQRWFAELNRLGAVTHLSGRATSAAPGATAARGVALDWPLLAVLVLSARLAGWGDPLAAEPAGDRGAVRFATGATAHLTIEPLAPDRPPHWEVQAASPTGALRVEMLPTPTVERDGDPVDLPPSTDPAETFGAAPLLRTLLADVRAGRRPVLDARFGRSVERLRAQLSRAR